MADDAPTEPVPEEEEEPAAVEEEVEMSVLDALKEVRFWTCRFVVEN